MPRGRRRDAAAGASRVRGRQPRAAHLPRRLRVAPGHAPRPRVRHARGPRADRARQRPRADARAARRAAPSGPTCASPGSCGARRCRGIASASRRAPGSRCTTTTSPPAPGATRCASRSGTTDDPAPRYWVRVDGINVGMARVGAVRVGRLDAAQDVARARAPQPDGARRAALLPDRAAPLRAHAGLRHPRPGPVLAALVLAAPRRHGLRRPVGRNRPAFWSQDDH